MSAHPSSPNPGETDDSRDRPRQAADPGEPAAPDEAAAPDTKAIIVPPLQSEEPTLDRAARYLLGPTVYCA